MSDFINTRETLGEQETLDALVAHTLTEFKEDGFDTLGQYAFYRNGGLQLVDLPSVTTAGTYTMQYCTALKSASFAGLKKASDYMFSDCNALTTVSLPQVTEISQYAFQNCFSLQSANFPLVTKVGNYAFKNARVKRIVLPATTTLGTYLNHEYGSAEVDLSAKPTSIVANAFNSAYNMTALILRYSEMIPLTNVNAFTNTPIQAGYGWIYVPSDLVDTYKSATNWSTFAEQIVSIDEYPKAISCETITDSWADILAAEANGNYASKYSIGDTKFVEINGVPVLMQIAAIDGDELADGTGYAKITWLCKGFQGSHNMNPTNVTTGGWVDSNMRSYLRDVVYPGIDSTVRNSIKEVKKTYYDVGTSSTLSSTDTIWIPSYREVGFGTNKESTGIIYSGLFSDNASRIKKPSITNAAAADWWLRSAYNGTSFYIVGISGYSYHNTASISNGVVFGFCT